MKMDKEEIHRVLDFLNTCDVDPAGEEENAELIQSRIATYMSANIDDFIECYEE